MLRPLWIVGILSSTKILPVVNLKNMASSFESQNLDFEFGVAKAGLSQTFEFLSHEAIFR